MKMGHVELAKKMRKRDPATAPTIGDRVAYVHLKVSSMPPLCDINLVVCLPEVLLGQCWPGGTASSRTTSIGSPNGCKCVWAVMVLAMGFPQDWVLGVRLRLLRVRRHATRLKTPSLRSHCQLRLHHQYRQHIAVITMPFRSIYTCP